MEEGKVRSRNAWEMKESYSDGRRKWVDRRRRLIQR